MKKSILLVAAVLGMLFLFTACSGNDRSTASNETGSVDVGKDRDTDNAAVNDNRNNAINDLNNDNIEESEPTTKHDDKDLGDKTEAAMDKIGDGMNDTMDDVGEALDGKDRKNIG